MAKANRLLHLITLLRANRSMDSGRLARELGVSERTVYRDITALSEINVPVYSDRYGYHLGENQFLPVLNLDSDEYFLLKSLLETPLATATSETRATAKRLAEKVDAVLSGSVRVARKGRQSVNRMLVRSSHDPAKVEAWMPVLNRAIQSDSVIELQYDSLERGPGMRELEPYMIVFRGHAYYLIAYSTDHKEFRQYRLDRISEVRVTKQHFFPRAEFNAEEFYAQRWEFEGEGEWQEVVVQLSGRAAKIVSSGKRIEGEIVTKLEEGVVRYAARVRGLEEITRWIAGFGSDAEVLEPEELRAQFSLLGEYLTRKYATKVRVGDDRSARLTSIRKAQG